MVAKRSSRALALLLALPEAAFALGLGDIRLLSSLNTPLNAQIELVDVVPGEASRGTEGALAASVAAEPGRLKLMPPSLATVPAPQPAPAAVPPAAAPPPAAQSMPPAAAPEEKPAVAAEETPPPIVAKPPGTAPAHKVTPPPEASGGFFDTLAGYWWVGLLALLAAAALFGLRILRARRASQLNDSLEVGALDTVDQPGLASAAASTSDAPTLVAGLDGQSRKVMEEARSQRIDVDVGQASGTHPMSARDVDIDVGTASVNRTANGSGLDLDVGTAMVPDGAFASTQRLPSEDLALPELEPVTLSEVGTKLDLARAYLDMGDPDGARNILEEVLGEGSVAQKQEAQRLMELLP